MKRFELNFDEDKINDILDEDGASYDLKECCELLNEQQDIIESERDLFEKYKASAIRDIKDYSDKIIEMQKKVDEQQDIINKKKELIKLIADACTYTKEHSVKEILRKEIEGIDSVAGEFASAWHDYVILSKFFKECYGEYWDND